MTPTTTSGQPASSQQQPPSDQAVVAALVVVLLSGLPFAAMAAYVAAVLAPLGIGVESAEEALALLFPRLRGVGTRMPGAAQDYVRRAQPLLNAMYLLRAAQRLNAGGSPDAERGYLAQLLAASSARERSAKEVDTAALQYGPVLGWYAMLDARTTPACRAAHGQNFAVAPPPRLGYPGTLHGGTCRCQAGPPFRGGGSVDEATKGLELSATVRRPLVQAF